MNKKMKDLKNLNESDLKNKLEELEKELIKESAQIAIGTVVKKPAKIKNMKKNRARIMFLLDNMQKSQTQRALLDGRQKIQKDFFSADNLKVQIKQEVKQKA